MNRTLVESIPGLPEALQEFTRNAPLFDSSCSENARVWFADRDGGVYIKSASAGALKAEAEMTAFFHSRGLGAEVLAYLPLEKDWMVTRAIPGEDCLYPPFLGDPKRLSETLGQLLRQLHETDCTGCPVQDLNTSWFSNVPNHLRQQYPDLLSSRVLVHGDYCLPNVMLRDWQFSGYIDVGGGGVGDRHLDLYWGCWSILYNLKQERWCSRFLDAYGREDVDTEKLRIIADFEAFG